MIAALFVDPTGPYVNREGVDPWTEDRDARTYPGPWSVVAHPPCASWGRLWHRTGRAKGDDGGCFAAAVAAVQRWGGVLEHPADSAAWAQFRLPRPGRECWASWLLAPGWATEVDQGAYGHMAQKRTWLYYVGPPPPPLDWSTGCPVLRPVEQQSKRQRRLTPPRFAETLIDLARHAALASNLG